MISEHHANETEAARRSAPAGAAYRWAAACWLVMGIALAARGQAPTATEIVLHSFPIAAPLGAFPEAGLIADPAGNLYGTATVGGAGQQGTIFKIDTSGQKTVLYNFVGGAFGSEPVSGVVRDSAGNLYGTTPYGGNMSGCVNGCGVVYRLDTVGNYTVLYTFRGGADGAQPYAGVILDDAGNLYGTASTGGLDCPGSACGLVYKLDAFGNETVLYSFTGTPDGNQPTTGVIRDAAGNLYGVTQYGGANYAGTVYKIDASGNETVLYNFAGGSDGYGPNSNLVMDAAGDLYGTTNGGGTSFNGVIFKMDTSNNESVLYNFAGSPDGAGPNAIIRDAHSNFYGTTLNGGTGNSGTVFKLDAGGHETVLYNFTGGTDGGNPEGGVIRDSNGSLYGTANHGGAAGTGTVYKLNPSNQETVLCNFPSSTDGSEPDDIVFDAMGNLYGNTELGGKAGDGTIYKVDATGHETVLYSFAGTTDGCAPQGPMALDDQGNLYGVAAFCGSGLSGVVFKLDPAGNQSVIYAFPNFPWPNGAFPLGGVIRDESGNLYGTAQFGPSTECPFCLGSGVVYKLDTSGNQTVLYAFTGGSDGGGSSISLTRDAEGNLYGTTSGGGSASLGVVYKIDPAGNETVLHDFTGDFDGANPNSGVVRDAAGNLYGTTTAGGKENMGVLYKVSPKSIETVLHTFSGGLGGGQPYGGMALDAAGNVYGTTCIGGTANDGVVFVWGQSGFQVLHNFSGGADGSQPFGALVAKGNAIYGTTSLGGSKSGGVVFRLTP